jgi:hypothetical protein
MRFPCVLLLLLGLLVTTALADPVPVTVDPTRGLRRGGQPYFVKGAGGETRLPELAARGANSIRTWSTDGLVEILAQAETLGMTVSAGIWLESECSWFSYSNPAHCLKQTERVREQVLRFRDHPALLAWGIGNESEGDGTNAAYWQQLEKLALLVKEIDPAHPTFTAVAGLSPAKANGLNGHTPHLDYVGINTYGGLFTLRPHLEKIGWRRPWMLTEWGPQGFWERPKSPSGAPLEQTSTEKADMMRRGYDEVISKAGSCLGSYVFLWAWKFEATATWFGLFTHDGKTTAAADVLQEKWTGAKPQNLAPAIENMRGVPDSPLAPGTTFTASTAAIDPDGDALEWHWAVLPESTTHNAGLRPKMPPAVEGAIQSTRPSEATVKAPAIAGIYRIHVWISDPHGHAATANTPFEVK